MKRGPCWFCGTSHLSIWATLKRSYGTETSLFFIVIWEIRLDLGPHDGMIVMGGPQSANDQEMAAEIHFIQQALDTKTPILGICLGAQLIAKALGAHVYRNPEKEIGWAPV